MSIIAKIKNKFKKQKNLNKVMEFLKENDIMYMPLFNYQMNVKRVAIFDFKTHNQITISCYNDKIEVNFQNYE